MTLLWLKGLLVGRSGRLLGAMAGVGVTVALLASIGIFIASSAASMTQRAIATVPIDWQILLASRADIPAVAAAVRETTPTSALEPVGFADAAGFIAQAGGTVQTTGPGTIVGVSPQYGARFPAELRPLIGSATGVLIAQQTAATLHVTPGDTVTIQRVGLPAVTVTIDGVVDLPSADSLFQAVGAPAGMAPQAPPDNVMLLPMGQWDQLFGPQAAVRPDSVRMQLHVRIAHALPPDPAAAYTHVQQLARHVEARVAGRAVVGDNLGARLLATRADALYAQVLFLFLGLPGVIVAGLLTLAVAASGSDRRRREQALLRIRGASTAQLLGLASVEALTVGCGGVALGMILAIAARRLIASPGVSAGSLALVWAGGAAAVGLLLAVGAVLTPAWHQAHRSTVAAARAVVGRPGTPLWRRLYVDGILIATSFAVLWQMARSGYQTVLAPEGVPQSSVAYQAFLAPLCLWAGAGLLAMRLSDCGLERGRRTVAGLVRPVARGLAGVVAASLARQRALVSRGVVFVGLALSFAVSTAIFNSTYNAQARVDAELTNGADVTVRAPSGASLNSVTGALRAVPGVSAASQMQHRFAYVGTDLQDLYGIDPAHIGEASPMSDAFFASGHARTTLAALAARVDGVLVSAETATQYQLHPGDTVNLRLQSARDHQYHVVPFHFVDVVREFPTAPKDSFLVANAEYIARQTATDAANIVLLRVGNNPGHVAGRVRALLSSVPGATVTDIGSVQRSVSSGLTAVDLRGLTALELAFAVLLVAGATGLVLALGLAERRRTFAILAALGASERQLGAFLWSEGLAILVGGSLVGAAIGIGVARMLVALLTGVFDPPPQSLSVPWAYLGFLAAAAIASAGAAVLGAQMASRRSPVEALRAM
jgi:putative ABC transport system permease protein